MIIKQTRNIIVRFIQLYPTTWRLLDVRYDVLSILIEAGELSEFKKNETTHYLISKLEKNEKNELSHNIKPDQYSLLHEESLHMPQISSWEENIENTINKAYLGYLLEYYSNKAVKNIRWMITVCKILPKLYKKDY
ncbi:9655_t:CDS:2, partial [Dentiscutata erythropus]